MTDTKIDELLHLKQLRAHDQLAYAELERKLVSGEQDSHLDKRYEAAKRRIERISTKIRTELCYSDCASSSGEASSTSALADITADESISERVFGNDILDDLEALSGYVMELCEMVEYNRIDGKTQIQAKENESERLKSDYAEARSTIARLEVDLEAKAQDCERADDEEIRLRKENEKLRLRVSVLQAKLQKLSVQSKQFATQTAEQRSKSPLATRSDAGFEEVNHIHAGQDTAAPKKKVIGQAPPFFDVTNKLRSPTKNVVDARCTRMDIDGYDNHPHMKMASNFRDVSSPNFPHSLRDSLLQNPLVGRHIRD